MGQYSRRIAMRDCWCTSKIISRYFSSLEINFNADEHPVENYNNKLKICSDTFEIVSQVTFSTCFICPECLSRAGQLKGMHAFVIKRTARFKSGTCMTILISSKIVGGGGGGIYTIHGRRDFFKI